ncbi:MAG: twitching motility response regulator PilH [Methylophaga sp.]|jgi:twitching motility two-component system response regulator PilH|nr:twitching motility response regulator PilH [Methylophaga sp.]MED5509258.1 twitching motility response regulator PilH [Pseudomonadota bacterium]
MARILIADDSPTEVYVLQKMLEKNGHQVLVAEDGEQAVQQSQQNKPDLILMDVVMPNLNGFQATRKLTKDPQTSHIPIIIVSSKNQETDKMWGLRQGARGYLGKPVTEQDLMQQINDLLGQ